MTDAEYQAQLEDLNAQRAALENTYITTQDYPRWAYHATEPAQIIASEAEAQALGAGWSETPVPRVPVVTALAPATAVLGSPSFTIQVIGTGFVAASVIVWNGGDEPTTYVADTELTTGVNMATASTAGQVVVGVRNPDGALSNTKRFVFTEATP